MVEGVPINHDETVDFSALEPVESAQTGVYTELFSDQNGSIIEVLGTQVQSDPDAQRIFREKATERGLTVVEQDGMAHVVHPNNSSEPIGAVLQQHFSSLNL
jgi:hypothetical protein